MKAVLIIIWTVWMSANLFGQGNSRNIDISEQPEIRELLDYFILTGKEEPYIEGWRIKVISTTDRRQMENARYKLSQLYPEVTYDVSYESPYYSLKVGAFEDRFEVEPYLQRIKIDFPSAIPYRDRIMKSELFIANGL